MSIHHHHHHVACPVVTTVELSPQVTSTSSCSWHGAVLLPKWLHSSITITLHAEFIECCDTKSALEVDKMLTVWSYTSLKSFKYTFKNSSAINSEVVMAGWQNKHKSDSIIHGHAKQGWLGGGSTFSVFWCQARCECLVVAHVRIGSYHVTKQLDVSAVNNVNNCRLHCLATTSLHGPTMYTDGCGRALIQHTDLFLHWLKMK